MLRVVIVVVLALLLGSGRAVASDGSIQLAWQSCDSDSGAAFTVCLSCSATTTVHMLGTFDLTNAAPQVVALDVVLDWVFASPSVPPFWHFQSGGCNESGLTIRDQRPDGICGSSSRDLCLDGSCQAFMTYAVGSSIGIPEDRARVLATIYRPQDSPVGLEARPTRHFAFDLAISLDQGSSCDGCTTLGSVAWSQATLYGPESVVARLTSSDPGSQASIGINGIWPDKSCHETPTRRTSWGVLKSRYR